MVARFAMFLASFGFFALEGASLGATQPAAHHGERATFTVRAASSLAGVGLTGGMEIVVSEYVVIPPMRGGTGRPEKVKTHRLRADHSGMATVDLQPGSGFPQVEAFVEYNGARFTSGMQDPRKGAVEIVVHRLAPAKSDLAAVMWCRASAEEAVLLIECVLRFSVRGKSAVRMSTAGPRIPFLGYRLGDQYYLDHTITSKAFAHFRADTNAPTVRLVRDGQGLFLDGVVTPEAPVTARVRYHIPHDTDETQVGFVAPFDISVFSLHVESARTYPTKLTVSLPGERATTTEEQSITQQFRTKEPIRAGQSITVTLSNLPRYNPWWRRFMAFAMMAIFGAVVLVWLRFRSEERAGE